MTVVCIASPDSIIMTCCQKIHSCGTRWWCCWLYGCTISYAALYSIPSNIHKHLHQFMKLHESAVNQQRRVAAIISAKKEMSVYKLCCEHSKSIFCQKCFVLLKDIQFWQLLPSRWRLGPPASYAHTCDVECRTYKTRCKTIMAYKWNKGQARQAQHHSMVSYCANVPTIHHWSGDWATTGLRGQHCEVTGRQN